MKRKGLRGAATLPVILILGGLVLEVTVATAFIVFVFGRSGYGDRLSMEALAAARSGVMDGIARVVADKDFSDADGYSLTVGDRTAAITITRDVPEEGKTRVTATGTALVRKRKIQADLKVDSETGKADIISFEEINL